ncbi:MAG TPA: hypothetical protein VFS02_16950 [Telluria sp.]|nr:hypothetical protein [Telluria sp.]
MSKTVRRLSCLLLAMAISPTVQAAEGIATISYADQPVRLFRDTSFYLASRGAQLQAGDIVESGVGGLQLEAHNSATIALGPASRICLKAGEPILLDGWMKIQASASTALKFGGGGLAISAAGGSVILHAAGGKIELFVDTGEPSVAEMEGARTVRTTRFPREQYAVRAPGQPLKLLPRPPKEFLAGMPAAFQDTLMPVAVKGPAPAPKLERRAAFADVAPWLAAEPALHQAIHRRFNPPPKPHIPAYTY